MIIVNLFLIVFNIIASFSRGTYLSLFLFVILSNVLLFRKIGFKKIILYDIIFITSLSILAFWLKDSFVTTVSFNKTVSQKRSINGRIDIWKNNKEIFNTNITTGYGQGNYVLSQGIKNNTTEDKSFSSISNNAYLETLIERGILGIICYLLFFLIILYILIKSIKSKKSNTKHLLIILSFLIAYSFHELTFSSFLTNNIVTFLLFHLVFFLIPFDISLFELKMNCKQKKVLISLLFSLILMLSFLNGKRFLIKKYNNGFVKNYYDTNGTNEDNFKLLNRALYLSPQNITLNKNAAASLLKNHLKIKISHKEKNLLSFNKYNSDTLNLSKKYLKNIIKINPYDDESFHNLGWIYFAQNNQNLANFYFNKSLQLNPYNSIFHISKALFDLKYLNQSQAINHVKEAVTYSPEILESYFFDEFSKKYLNKIDDFQNSIVNDIKDKLKCSDNTIIIKARLARILIDKEPKKAEKTLNEIVSKLPNMNRPWAYLAYLNIKKGNTSLAKKYLKRSFFLSQKDILPYYYHLKYIDLDDLDSILKLIDLYSHIKTPSFNKNGNLSDLSVISNTYIPHNLIYYTKVNITKLNIPKTLEKHIKSLNDKILEEKYSMALKKYVAWTRSEILNPL